VINGSTCLENGPRHSVDFEEAGHVVKVAAGFPIVDNRLRERTIHIWQANENIEAGCVDIDQARQVGAAGQGQLVGDLFKQFLADDRRAGASLVA